jgi:hypothetical protein
VLGLLAEGQYLNCSLPGKPELGGEPLPRQVERSAAATDEVRRCVARVLVCTGQQIGVRPELPVERFPTGESVVLDFTDSSGTYFLETTVVAAHAGIEQRVVLDVRRAALVQLRRFVRVPVLITPLRLEVLRDGWRPVAGQVLDVSVGGLGLLVAEPLEAGSSLRAEIDLPGRYGKLVVTGEVVAPPGPAEGRAERVGSAPLYRRGVAFAPLAMEDLHRLQRALYARQVELRRSARLLSG